MGIYNEDDYATVYTEEAPAEAMETAEEESEPVRDDRWKHTIVSRVAYLLGVGEEHFSEEDVFDRDIFETLNKEKSARIIRNLCALRTAILRNGGDIHKAITYEMRNLSTLPELIPQKSLKELSEDGIIIEKANYRLNNYTIDINDHIRSRIGNVKQFFPDWVNWDYVKEIFLMPGGTKEAGVVAEAKRYAANKNTFPFRVYINWAYNNCGNVLYHDGNFLCKLYETNEDRFEDMSKVRDASEETKTSIYDFLRESGKTSLIVDCENSDPYKLYAVLRNLDQKELLSKIGTIVLFDDFHTTDAWKLLEDFTEIPVIYKQIDRVKENKSLVDQTLMITATKMALREGVDSFILAASDSDYWALMQELPENRFLVMGEYSKMGPDIKEAMAENGIMFCYMDDFCTDNISDIKERMLLREIRTVISDSVKVNLNDVLEQAIFRSRMDLTQDERAAYYKRIARNIRVEIGEDGTLKLTF